MADDYTYSHNGNQLATLNGSMSYSYDSNGNMTHDGRQGLDYLGSLIYKRNGSLLELESVAFDGGRLFATVSASNTIYETKYFLTDHLGSIRVVVNGSTGQVEERNDYHPYGKRWNDSNNLI